MKHPFINAPAEALNWSSALRDKLSFTIFLFREALRCIPVRAGRIGRHFTGWKIFISTPKPFGLPLTTSGRILLWTGECLFLLLDLMGFPECFEAFNLWLKPRSRPLSTGEMDLARPIFGNTLPYNRIRLDERAHLGPRQFHFCYVSFCLINSWREMDPAILIHELVHIWQFQRYGSPYILRALLAQRTPEGYNYGSLDNLRRAEDLDLGFSPFNYEQQASIVEDYFRLQRGNPLGWSKSIIGHPHSTYQYFIRILKVS